MEFRDFYDSGAPVGQYLLGIVENSPVGDTSGFGVHL